jgi:hypothetical protein
MGADSVAEVRGSDAGQSEKLLNAKVAKFCAKVAKRSFNQGECLRNIERTFIAEAVTNRGERQEESLVRFASVGLVGERTLFGAAATSKLWDPCDCE